MQNLKALIFDADGTLLEAENPYLSIAKALSCELEVRDMVKKYLNNDLSYEELVAKETDLFIQKHIELYERHPRVGDLERFLPTPEIREGVMEALDHINGNGKQLFVLSSGFTYLIEYLIKLKIKRQNIYANSFLYTTSGDFAMIKIDVNGEKIQGYELILQKTDVSPEEVCYIGDNAFDESVMKYALERGSKVFFLDKAEKDFELKNMPDHENFIRINSLTNLVTHLSS